MAMDNLREYFRLRCTQMLAAERDILQMNNMMADEVQNPRLKQMFQQHSQPTQQQISNLEQVLNRLGGPMEQSEGMMTRVQETLGMGASEAGQGVPVTKAMMREHEMMKSMKPSQQILDINDALEGDKVEHFEISSYRGLIMLAQQLGEADIVQMLQQNLQGEEQARSTIESQLPTLMTELGGGGRMAA